MTNVARNSSQPRKVHFVKRRSRIVLFEKHRHIDGSIDHLACNTQIVVIEHDSFGQVVLGTIHDIGQCAVRLVVFARFYFYGQYLATKFNHKIQLAPFFVVVIIGNDAMRHQLLRHCILVNRTEIDVFVSFDNPHLYPLCILAGQQSDIALEKFEQVTRTGKQEWNLWLFHVIDRQRNTCIRQPQEAILNPVEFGMFFQPFQDETFVLGVQFGGNKIDEPSSTKNLIAVTISGHSCTSSKKISVSPLMSGVEVMTERRSKMSLLLFAPVNNSIASGISTKLISTKLLNVRPNGRIE